MVVAEGGAAARVVEVLEAVVTEAVTEAVRAAAATVAAVGAEATVAVGLQAVVAPVSLQVASVGTMVASRGCRHRD